MRIWDIYLLKGELFFYQLSLALIIIQQNELFVPADSALNALKKLNEKFDPEELYKIIFNQIDISEEFHTEQYLIMLGKEKSQLMTTFSNDNL